MTNREAIKLDLGMALSHTLGYAMAPKVVKLIEALITEMIEEQKRAAMTIAVRCQQLQPYEFRSAD